MARNIESRTVGAIQMAQGVLRHEDKAACPKEASRVLAEVETELTTLAQERLDTDYYSGVGDAGSSGHIACGLQREQQRILRDLRLLLQDAEDESIWEGLMYRRLRNWVRLLEEFHHEEIRRFQESASDDYGMGE
jgi:hypothetical protein